MIRIYLSKGMIQMDLTGRKVNRLTALEQVCDERKGVYWLCRCDCGNLCVVRADNLLYGAVKSCGCLNKERVRAFAEMTFARAQKRKAVR